MSVVRAATEVFTRHLSTIDHVSAELVVTDVDSGTVLLEVESDGLLWQIVIALYFIDSELVTFVDDGVIHQVGFAGSL